MVFLKLGGSLITDKSRRETPQLAVIQRITKEISEALRAKPGMKLLIGHGSGSYGHPAAAEFGIRAGAETEEEWRGFAEVWAAANRLHRIMMDAFIDGGLSVFSFPPSSCALADRGEIIDFAEKPLRGAIDAGRLPVVYGDIAFDQAQGASIVSTERVLSYLAGLLGPERILMAGVEEGVYEHYPTRDRVLPEITPTMLDDIQLKGSEATDVTGGMAHKVDQAIELADLHPELEVRIFSGVTSGNVQAALLGYALGTRVRA